MSKFPKPAASQVKIACSFCTTLAAGESDVTVMLRSAGEMKYKCSQIMMYMLNHTGIWHLPTIFTWKPEGEGYNVVSVVLIAPQELMR